jgi:hypothetical protein
MKSTTGTSIETYLARVCSELEKRAYGKVGIVFTVTAGQVTDVEFTATDKDHFPMAKGT